MIAGCGVETGMHGTEPGACPATALPDVLSCPLCNGTLHRDQTRPSPVWVCAAGHSYSTVRVLLTELAERGWVLDGDRLANRRGAPRRLTPDP
jgi:hypothetical protein